MVREPEEPNPSPQTPTSTTTLPRVSPLGILGARLSGGTATSDGPRAHVPTRTVKAVTMLTVHRASA